MSHEEINEYYLEYSSHAMEYNVSTLEAIILNNVEALKRGHDHGYVIIAGPLTLTEALDPKRCIFPRYLNG